MLCGVSEVTILVVRPHPEYTVQVRTIDSSDLREFQRLVDGYIQAIYSPEFTLFVNENASFEPTKYLPNAVGSVLAARHGWPHAVSRPLLGTVVFLGAGATEHGDVLSVSDELITDATETAERMLGHA